jgi:hypothetical protein
LTRNLEQEKPVLLQEQFTTIESMMICYARYAGGDRIERLGDGKIKVNPEKYARECVII